MDRNRYRLAAVTHQRIHVSFSSLISAMLLCVWLPGRAAEFFAAPNGLPTGDGSFNRPWDLQTAFSHPRILKPGDTIRLRGGTYTGPFDSKLVGTAGRPITLRPFKQEAVKFDAPAPPPAPPPPAQWSAPLFLIRQNVGGWTIYRDMEFYWSHSNRTPGLTLNDRFRPTGITLRAPNVKIINNVFHDLGTAAELWEEALNAEFYGNLIFNTGWQDGQQQGTGHCIYAQNRTGRKLIQDNVFANGYGYGFHAYSQNAALEGFDVIGNIALNCGAHSSNAVRKPNYFLGGASGVRVSGNFEANCSFHPLDYPDSLGFQCEDGRGDKNISIRFRKNVSVGGKTQFRGYNYERYDFQENIFYGRQRFVFAGPISDDSVFAQNTYWGADSSSEPFRTHTDEVLDSSAWKDYAGEQDIQTTTTALTGQWIFVRPNLYEPKRAHVAVYDFDLSDSFELDAGGVLVAGDTFTVRNAQDYFGPPTLTGTYTGGRITLPLTHLTIAHPIGSPYPPLQPTRIFNAFVLIGSRAGTLPPPP